jgi:HEAT repeat protein
VVYVLYALAQTKSFPPPGECDADKYLKAVPAHLRSQNYWATKLAAELLQAYSRGADTATVAELAALLHDEDVSVRWQAVKLLGKIGTKAAATIPELTELLNDHSLVQPTGLVHDTISSEAAEALRQIDPEAAKRAGVK